MRIDFKPGTEVRLLTTFLLKGLTAFAEMAGGEGASVVTVTSVNEGKHKHQSLHYVGNAVDIRSKAFTPAAKQAILLRFKANLDADYDLILEAEGQVHEHFHLEYDPGNQSH